MDHEVIIIGAGLAGLVAACEIARAGKKVLLLDQEPETNMGGQAWWSFGGLFLVDSPEQRRLGIHDSKALAWQSWQGSAGYDREEDDWGMKWAKAYIEFAAGEKRQWLHELGIRFFPIVGWAERGGHLANGHGNSVPRFHIVWGTGPAIVAPFEQQVRQYMDRGLIDYKPRHRVDQLLTDKGRVGGVSGAILAPSSSKRGEPSNRTVVGGFDYSGHAILIASGGIGGNHELVRKNWPKRLGKAPQKMISGVPAHVDGRMLAIAEQAGGRIVNRDRMWHYTEGIHNWNSIWDNHGIRILPGPSSMWFDAKGKRFPLPGLPGFDTLGTLELIQSTGYDYSWFILTQSIIEKEFALSGSEQNPDLTDKSIAKILKRVLPGPPEPIQSFLDHGEDFIIKHSLEELVNGMNELTGEDLINLDDIRTQIEARDRDLENSFGKDLQLAAIRSSRKFMGDKLIRVAKPHKLLDPKNGPLIAVRLHIVSRKTLGGLQTDLNGQVLDMNQQLIPGLYAAGEASGFGGGGIHGYRSLEGTFLGGCLFTGRTAGHAISKL